jgi:uncharacterized protein
MKIKCPKCGKEVRFENNLFRPFCSERCRLVDLGDWLDGAYHVPAVEDEEEDGKQEPGEELKPS